jgi:putative Ca2+/H+ antiporter (TMEM165/GDT1 family)
MVVAAPLFLVVLLTVMAINQGQSVIFYGFVLSLVFIPLCQVVIGALIGALNPKVWT